MKRFGKLKQARLVGIERPRCCGVFDSEISRFVELKRQSDLAKV